MRKPGVLRSLVPTTLCVLVCCSSPQAAAPAADGAEGHTAAAPEPVASPGPGECSGAPWETQDEDGPPPPVEYLACTTGDECVEQRMVGCCGSFVVAVNARFRHCIAARNAAATCVAYCASRPPEWIPPVRSGACVEGSCRLVLGDGTPDVVISLPFDLHD
jgi:hypothetical protein